MESQPDALTTHGILVACALAIALTAACRDTNHQQAARADLAKVLADSVGIRTDRVSYVVDGKAHIGDDNHLQLEFDTAAFANMSDADFAARSQNIAAFAAQHYRGRPLDSVTVLAHQAKQPGVWKIVRIHTYAVRDLRRR